MSLGSCTGLFVIPTAKSLGVNLDGFEINLKGVKANKPPKLFDKIVMDINLIGEFDINLASKIIKESHKKCFILKSLHPNIEIENIIKVNCKVIK